MEHVSTHDEFEIRRYLDNLETELIEGTLSLEHLKKVLNPLIAVAKCNEPLPCATPYLKLVGEVIFSETSACKELSLNNKGIFETHIDEEFFTWNLQTISKDTQATKVCVYEQIKTSSFQEIFTSLGVNLNLLQFETHKQIEVFIEEHSDLLNPLLGPHSTFFLFTSKAGRRFVADIRRFKEGEKCFYCMFISKMSSKVYYTNSIPYRFVVLSSQKINT